MLRPRHEVSVKAAIYKADGSAVLVMRYLKNSKYPWEYGLPGGHLENNETPDEAVIREIQEEVGMTVANPKRVDFFLRGGKRSSVILGYSVTVPNEAEPVSSEPELEVSMWVSRKELKELPAFSPEYVRMALANWPK